MTMVFQNYDPEELYAHSVVFLQHEVKLEFIGDSSYRVSLVWKRSIPHVYMWTWQNGAANTESIELVEDESRLEPVPSSLHRQRLVDKLPSLVDWIGARDCVINSVSFLSPCPPYRSLGEGAEPEEEGTELLLAVVDEHGTVDITREVEIPISIAATYMQLWEQQSPSCVAYDMKCITDGDEYV